MQSFFLKRTNSGDPDFIALVRHLDAELTVRDGDEHAFYDQFNKLVNIKYVVVAYHDGRAVGCGAIKPLEEKVMEVKRMFVFPEERGKGIALKVLSELERWASELGAQACYLETGLRQPEAIALYQKNGYERIPNYGQYVGVENSVCFRKVMQQEKYTVRNAEPGEFSEIGKLMVQVYSQLEGFPKETEQPAYYQMLAHIGDLTNKPETELLVAVSADGKIAGAVVFFGDMQYYGSGGTATQEKNAAGFRLLAVSPIARGQGVGKLLTMECIRKAKAKKARHLVIHTTAAMQTAWKMYENLGFKRAEDLDFMQGELPVFGFRLVL